MYTFTLIIKRYKRENPTLDDMKSIYSNKVCLVSKNLKNGGVYIHKTGKIIKGSFEFSAGSFKHPILIAKEEVCIKFTNFPHKPNIKTDQFKKQDIIILKHD